jgi:hypothetical protein
VKRDVAAVVGEPNAELKEDLRWAKELYLMHEHGTGSQRDKRRKRLASIVRTAKRLRKLLSDDEGEPALRLGPIPESPIVYLSRIVAVAEAKLAPSLFDIKAGKILSDEIGIGRLSALEWLVGEHLPKIYEKHIGPVTRGRTTRGRARIGEGDSYTAYVIFAQEQLARWGITQSGGQPQESIIRAMSYAAKGGRRVGKSR